MHTTNYTGYSCAQDLAPYRSALIHDPGCGNDAHSTSDALQIGRDAASDFTTIKPDGLKTMRDASFSYLHWTAHYCDLMTATNSHNVIDLRAEETKVGSVTLYPDCAEVTRSVWVNVEKETNKLVISGLPTKLDKDSVRIRGQGHPDSVVGRIGVSNKANPKPPAVDPKLRAFERKKAAAQTSLLRTKESIRALQHYIGALDSQHVTLQTVSTVLDGYEKNTKRLDDKVADIEDEIAALELEIQKIRPDCSRQPDLQTTISVEILAGTDGEVDVYISYFIKDCKWEPSYDIHASVNGDTANLDLVYKATITQNTAEDWSKATLTLETLSPSLEIQSQELQPWKISLTDRFAIRPPHWHGHGCRSTPGPTPAPAANELTRSMPRSRSAASGPPPAGGVPVQPQAEQAFESDDVEEMQMLTSLVNVNESTTIAHSTFRIPGEVTIEGNGEAHAFVITTVKLSGTVAWVTMPKIDPRAHIKGKFINTSDFPLLKGKANVYLDGAFMKRTELSSISPGEKFDLALGHDPSIRLIYPRRHQLSGRPGYTYAESSTNTFEQRILISNGKKLPVDLKVVDQIPVSGNSILKVKLITPALVVPTPASSKKPGGGQTLASSAQASQETAKTASVVKKGVTADWESEGTAGRKEGMIAWECHLDPQESIELLLKWSVECTESRYLITGL